MKPKAKEIINSSIITAFTIAVALIWKDVITALIETLVPAGNDLWYQLLTAIISTIIVILAIYFFLETEEKAEYVLDQAERFTHTGKYRKDGGQDNGPKNQAEKISTP